MTKTLIVDKMSAKVRKALQKDGVYLAESPYSEAPYPITRKLVEDGERHLVGERLIETGCPVHILQGVRDDEVPWRIATGLVSRLASDDVVVTLVKDGDHRLSRPEDIERLIAAVDGIVAEAG